jgi:hypothetical protein
MNLCSKGENEIVVLLGALGRVGKSLNLVTLLANFVNSSRRSRSDFLSAGTLDFFQPHHHPVQVPLHHQIGIQLSLAASSDIACLATSGISDIHANRFLFICSNDACANSGIFHCIVSSLSIVSNQPFFITAEYAHTLCKSLIGSDSISLNAWSNIYIFEDATAILSASVHSDCGLVFQEESFGQNNSTFHIGL